MRLKKLVLYGFKSFATRTEIVFNEGITGIVGPNGSGKSNIGDAVRWVLGEQSAKTLRGASMSDVIFNGTQKRKPLSYCEVSLVFDNEDRALPMDFSEIMVTRRVYRSGESEYFLNQASCRLKDIVDLFRDTGIGKEGYSIIGQGRIDEILSRRSEDRRQIFEEAAGIVKFKARKEDADKKLQRTLENAARIDDILEELSRQLGPLEAQSRDAREYLELFGELKLLDLNLFLIRSDKAQARLAELDEELDTLRTILADAEATLNEKTVQRDARQEEIADLEARITAARNDLMACAQSVHESENALAAVRSRKETRQENRQRVMDEQTAAAQRLAELETLFESSDSEISRQEDFVRAAQENLQKAEDDADAAEQAETDADEALEAHKSALLSAMNRLSDVRNNQTRLRTMRGQMEARLAELEQSDAQMSDEEQRLSDAVTAARERVNAEEARQNELNNAWQASQDNLRKVDLSLSVIRTENDKLNASIQETQSRYRLLREMTQEMEGYNQSVRRAVQYGKERRIPGVKGVLAQLISVPAAYETAIDMALGGALQNIVTDDEQTAKTLIDFLRNNRMGRATFLPISTVRSKTLYDRERHVLHMPGCVGVASDLIECAPEYRGIIENLLGRTVIADNLDHGIPIMKAGNHAFRLVTLQGDVMHSGGSMTGGSAQSKMVSLLSREREVKELEGQLTAIKTRLNQQKALLDSEQARKDNMKQAVNDALNALHQQEIAVARENERMDSALSELAAHQDRMEQSRQAAEQLREAMSDIDAQLADIEQTDGSVLTDRNVMEQRTEALQQALIDARAASDEAKKTVMTRSLQLSDLNHTLDVMRRDADRCTLDREQLLHDRERRETLLRNMALQDQDDLNEISVLTFQVETRSAEQAAQEQATQALESSRTAAQDDLRQLLTAIESLHQAMTRDADHMHRSELARSKVDSDLRTLQDRIWNTYELTYAGAEEYRQAEGFNIPESERRAAQLSSRIKQLGNVNVHAVDEYAQTKARFDDLTAQQNDLRQAEKDLRELIEKLLGQMEVTFVKNFTLLQGYFSETFVRLFGGGHAELTLMDPSDPLNCGIEVNAQPPGKKLQLLSLLSGGERALTAIAILFAMLKLKPTPFCILDEIEAALDDANIGYYADYLKEYSEGTQFIVVTHRKGTMERCNALYGVAMEEQGVSRMVSVSLQDYET